MRVILAALTIAFAGPAMADVAVEQLGVESLGLPSSHWVIVNDVLGRSYIFDGDDGEMKGMLSGSRVTGTVETNPGRGEIYAMESFYSRGVRGTRADVVTIYDHATLTVKGEVAIPQKTAAGVPIRGYTGLLDDGRFMGVYNLSPSMSVSIVDVHAGLFVEEISTAGCALVLPSGVRSFVQICGDGRLQQIVLDDNGREIERTRSRRFFDVQNDPVTDKPARTARGWLFVSFENQVYPVTVSGKNLRIERSFSLVDEADAEEGWRIGGHQSLAHHRDTGFAFALMHQGGEGTHKDPGTQVWVVDIESRRRIQRITLENAASGIEVSQDAHPLLFAAVPQNRAVDVYDVRSGSLLRTIDEVGLSPSLLQVFGE
ncbi:MAG: amine dehydrogenase large subunit [Gammaproteobacteria bacterium]|jgi:methylamine dehydrogenase heavy chain